MNKEYTKELAKLKKRMMKAESFAKKIPVFKELILQDKITGEEDWNKFGERYKGLHLNWGINRGHYCSETNRTVNNFNKEYDCFLWSIYINTLTLYGEHEKFDLNEIMNNLDLFHYDQMNTIIYATDDQIEPLLEALLKWYLNAKETVDEYKKQKEILKLKKDLARLETTN